MNTRALIPGPSSRTSSQPLKVGLLISSPSKQTTSVRRCRRSWRHGCERDGSALVEPTLVRIQASKYPFNRGLCGNMKRHASSQHRPLIKAKGVGKCILEEVISKPCSLYGGLPGKEVMEWGSRQQESICEGPSRATQVTPVQGNNSLSLSPLCRKYSKMSPGREEIVKGFVSLSAGILDFMLRAMRRFWQILSREELLYNIVYMVLYFAF